MREAFANAEANLTAYPGEGSPETVGRVDDWRRLLDLNQPIDEPIRGLCCRRSPTTCWAASRRPR